MLLLSRSEHKLKSVQEEIVAKYPSVAVDYATVDFSKLTPAVLDKLRAKLSGLDVGVLVNNVGVSYEFCQWFHELTDSEARAREIPPRTQGRDSNWKTHPQRRRAAALWARWPEKRANLDTTAVDSCGVQIHIALVSFSSTTERKLYRWMSTASTLTYRAGCRAWRYGGVCAGAEVERRHSRPISD